MLCLDWRFIFLHLKRMCNTKKHVQNHVCQSFAMYFIMLLTCLCCFFILPTTIVESAMRLWILMSYDVNQNINLNRSNSKLITYLGARISTSTNRRWLASASTASRARHWTRLPVTKRSKEAVTWPWVAVINANNNTGNANFGWLPAPITADASSYSWTRWINNDIEDGDDRNETSVELMCEGVEPDTRTEIVSRVSSV